MKAKKMGKRRNVPVFKTVKELANVEGFLIVACLDCGHSQIKDALTLCHEGKADEKIQYLKFKCTECKYGSSVCLSCMPLYEHTVERLFQRELLF